MSFARQTRTAWPTFSQPISTVLWPRRRRSLPGWASKREGLRLTIRARSYGSGRRTPMAGCMTLRYTTRGWGPSAKRPRNKDGSPSSSMRKTISICERRCSSGRYDSGRHEVAIGDIAHHASPEAGRIGVDCAPHGTADVSDPKPSIDWGRGRVGLPADAAVVIVL